MKMKIALALAILVVVLGKPSRADQSQIRALKLRGEETNSLEKQLLRERKVLQLQADSLASHIDSLKSGFTSSDLLEDAYRSAITLEHKLMALGKRLEALYTVQRDIRHKLRTAYDWEIGVLTEQYSQTQDKGLLYQLIIYQEARELLGDEMEGTMRYGEQLDITAEDGPDEIRQKADLMEDRAEQLLGELASNSRRLRRLEEKFRLLSKVQTFTNQMNLFDEDPPESRLFHRVEQALPAGDAEMTLGASGDGNDAQKVAAATISGRKVAFGERRDAAADLSADNVQFEILKLKTRQQELRQLEALARERAQTFRMNLDKLLTGAE